MTVLLCFGREMPGGPTGSWKSVMGAELLGFRSLAIGGAGAAVVPAGVAMIARYLNG